MYPYNNVRQSSFISPMEYNGYRGNDMNVYPNAGEYPMNQNSGDERFFFAPFLTPFVVGGLAGTALGYGIANNNQLNNNQGYYYPAPYYPYPTYIYPSQNTYYF